MVARAKLTNQSTKKQLNFQFNPETLSRTKSSDWTELSTTEPQNQPRPQFTGHGSDQLTAKLLFDDTKIAGQLKAPAGLGDGPLGVDESIDLLFRWLTITEEDQRKQTPSPPTLRFEWGKGVSFTGVLKNVAVQYLRFDSDGKPTRATASITMRAVPDNPKPTNPTSGGLAGRTTERFDEGESLPSIAYKHYGDPNLWRAIAVSNGIVDPARIRIGTRLLVPRRVDAIGLNGPEADDA